MAGLSSVQGFKTVCYSTQLSAVVWQSRVPGSGWEQGIGEGVGVCSCAQDSGAFWQQSCALWGPVQQGVRDGGEGQKSERGRIKRLGAKMGKAYTEIFSLFGSLARVIIVGFVCLFVLSAVKWPFRVIT